MEWTSLKKDNSGKSTSENDISGNEHPKQDSSAEEQSEKGQFSTRTI